MIRYCALLFGMIIVCLGLLGLAAPDAFMMLTPVSTHPIPSVAWGWWSPDFVRPWALTTAALGLFVVIAVAPPRRFED